jgi:PBP1b-binding outer membrane lipoprotein LpoB
MTKILIAALALTLSTAAFAAKGNPTGGKFAKKHPRRSEVNKRVKNQRERINEDEKSGKITADQAKQLKANDRAIKMQEHAEVKANGGSLTKGEQKQLNQEENANSKLIRDEAHPAGQ